MQTRLLDYESYPLDGRAFLAVADSILAGLESQLEKLRGRDSVECLFYVGNAIGSKGLVCGKLSKWAAAVRYGIRARVLLAEVLARDSGFIAARLGVGAYDYYVGETLKYLPFAGGRAKDGLREIRHATYAPFPYDIGAKNTLCWIMLERRENMVADSIALSVLRSFPRNTIFLRIATCAAVAAGHWDSAVVRGQRLVELALSRTPVNWNDALTGYRAIVEAHAACGRKDECRAVALEALGLPVPEEYRTIPYVEQHRSRIRRILEDMNALRAAR